MCRLQVYALASTSSHKELEQFHGHLEEGMKQYKSNELFLVMGDFNANVDLKKAQFVKESQVLRVMNERGHNLKDWCQQNELCNINTKFQKKG